MNRIGSKKEYGGIEVEAVFIMPIAVLSTILLLYLSLFMFQRANLQAGLETALVYYKNTITDAHVTQNEVVSYVKTETSSTASGNSYEVEGSLNPYRGILGTGYKSLESTTDFEKYFRSIAGGMLFDDNMTFTVDVKNYALFKRMDVTVTQIVDAPIDFGLLGLGNKLEITATSQVNLVDHDDMIRNVDYAIDIVEDTKLGELAKSFATKFGEWYNKFLEVLEVKVE